MDSRFPRDDLFRAISPGVEIRASSEDDPSPVMVGHFARFDEWAEIDSVYEGHFMERIAPRAFTRTFADQTPKVLFQHGRDPELGDKPLGKPEVLEEDDIGARYEVPLFPSVPPLVVDGLRAGAYGASFRFRVVREDIDKAPDRSDHNPDGLPERTIREAEVMEFGPVTFPAYVGATAGVRSLTDEFRMEVLTHGEGLRKFSQFVATAEEATPTPAPTTSVSAPDEPKEETVQNIDRFATLGQLIERRDEIKGELGQLHTEIGVKERSPEQRDRWDDLSAELEAIEARIADVSEREAYIAKQARKPEARVVPFVNIAVTDGLPDNLFDRGAYRAMARSPEDEKNLLRSGALKIVDQAAFPGSGSRETAQGNVEKLVRTDSETAERVVLTGSDAYRRAFASVCRGRTVMSMQEQEALERAAFTLGTTGMPLVFDLDPTVLRTSNYVINPLRAISRVETITGTNEWRGVTSGAVTATYELEATEAADQTPTLTQPSVQVQRAQTFVPFSREVDQDWGAVQSEMAGLFQESKDILEATQFLSGAGTTVFPQGIQTGLTTTQRVQTATTAVFVVADLYSLQNALPPRARNAGSVFIASLNQLNRIRALDTSGGSSLWVQLGSGLPGTLLGMSAYELSTMATAITTTTKLMIVGDFARGYLIVDRIGMEIELIPHLFGASNRYPTGQRGLWAMWRNSAKVLDANRFRYLEVL